MQALGRMLVVGGLLGLSACGGGSTTGTNYSDPPPMAEIVATPSSKATEAPDAVATAAAEAEATNVVGSTAEEPAAVNAE